MAKSRGRRSVPLFSHEGAVLLSQPLSSGGQLEEEEVEGSVERETGDQSDIRRLVPSELFCLSCQVSLSNREEQVTHYRLDWHRYNLKRRLKGLSHVGQDEFERIAGDLSSISGSESSSDMSDEEENVPSEPEVPTGSPFVYFTAQDGSVHAIYKSVVTSSKSPPSGGALVELLAGLRQVQVWVILMRSGGHFAGAVFRGSSVLVHKTFHRYTVRAKRGTAQSVRDAQQGGHQPRSGGASLRRYNEAALEREILGLLASWSGHIEEASAIFIRTPKYSKAVFVGGKGAHFSKDDQRLRPIPFATRRPTLKEVKIVHGRLASIYSGFRPEKWSSNPERQSESMGCDHVTAKDDSTVKSEKHNHERTENVVVLETPAESVDLDGVDVEGGEVDGEGEKGRRRRRKNRKTGKEKSSKEAQGISPEIRLLLRVCEEGEGEEALVKVLQLMGLSPIHTEAHTTSLSPSHTLTPSPTQASGRPGSVPEAGGPTDSSAATDNRVGIHDSTGVHYNTGVHGNTAVLNALQGGQTMLHVAARSGQANIVHVLLQYGANPAIRDSSGHPPYSLAKERAVRDAFRRFMAQFPTAYDYVAAQVPSPLTEEQERERREKAAEKKRERRKAKKQKEKSEQELKSSLGTHMEAVTGLSEREKRALAAERRMIHQLPTDSAVQRAGMCSCCGESLAGMVPYERLQYKYCSMNCLKEHRAQLSKR